MTPDLQVKMVFIRLRSGCEKKASQLAAAERSPNSLVVIRRISARRGLKTGCCTQTRDGVTVTFFNVGLGSYSETVSNFTLHASAQLCVSSGRHTSTLGSFLLSIPRYSILTIYDLLSTKYLHSITL